MRGTNEKKELDILSELQTSLYKAFVLSLHFDVPQFKPSYHLAKPSYHLQFYSDMGYPCFRAPLPIKKWKNNRW